MFVLSKIVGALISPANLLLILLALAWLLHRRRPAASRRLLGLAVVALLLLAVAPVSHWVLQPLETRFLPPPELAHVDGIIVLGGALGGPAPVPGSGPSLNAHAERLTAMLALARRYPQAKLVYTGGSGAVVNNNIREADLTPPFFAALGLDPARLVLERESRNTWENALYSQRLAQPKAGETWLLVTSAWHMPRSVGCFRAANWSVVPYPVDYEAQGSRWGRLDIASEMEMLSYGIKEWIGLVSYRMLGRSPELLPGPQETGS